MLRAHWREEVSPFGYLSSTEQWDLHKYFQPSRELSDQTLIAHRKAISAADPSLPQRAGRALKHLEHALLELAVRQAATAAAPQDTKRKKTGDVRVRALMLPEPDYRKLARALLHVGRAEKGRGANISDVQKAKSDLLDSGM